MAIFLAAALDQLGNDRGRGCSNDIICKSLDLIHRTLSCHSSHGEHFRGGGVDSVKDAEHRLRRRERSSRP
jgi:hypothetical protein